MRMLPSAVHCFRSNAERKVFELLAAMDLGAHAFALHSLNLSQHEYKRWAELDFVVVWEEGAYALEIKGGRVSCHNGIWSFTNRFGVTNHKSEGPFDQAKSGHDALRAAIADHPKRPNLQDLCWGWGVVFPDFTFEESSVAWARELIADERTFREKDGVVLYLRTLASWWRGRGRGHHAIAKPAALMEIRNALRPDFDKVPSISAAVEQAVDAIVRLTDEQLSVLDAIDENARILCTGGAGTGKSFLAVEAARREALAGHCTLLLCRSALFAEFLRSRVLSSGVTTAGYSSIQRLLDEGAQFHTVIVDEAQDLLSSSCMSAIGGLLQGGLEAGRWRMFLDPNNQSGLHDPMEPQVLERLRALAAQHRLRRNCRNTEQIVLQTQLLTGADIGVAVIEGKGPPIELVDVTGERQTAAALEGRITDWLDSGIRPGHITILSPRPFDQSAARLLTANAAMQPILLDEAMVSQWPPRAVTFSTVRDFKGLENRCVAIVDLDGFSATPADIAELYVAMTRSHAGLWIAVPQGKRELLNRLIAEHTKRMLAGDTQS